MQYGKGADGFDAFSTGKLEYLNCVAFSMLGNMKGLKCLDGLGLSVLKN